MKERGKESDEFERWGVDGEKNRKVGFRGKIQEI